MVGINMKFGSNRPLSRRGRRERRALPSNKEEASYLTAAENAAIERELVEDMRRSITPEQVRWHEVAGLFLASWGITLVCIAFLAVSWMTNAAKWHYAAGLMYPLILIPLALMSFVWPLFRLIRARKLRRALSEDDELVPSGELESQDLFVSQDSQE